MASKKVVHLFYDVISPYSWIAFELLTRHQRVWSKMDLRLRPFFLGGVMRGASNTPPALAVPNKGKYMPIDIARLSYYYRIPIQIPGNFFEIAFNRRTIDSMRFVVAIKQLTTGQEALEQLSRQIWIRMFTTHEDIAKEESLREAGLRAGLAKGIVDKGISMIQDQGVKDQLKRNTDEALNEGAFGAPTIIVDVAENQREMIFGSDRMEILAHMIGEEYQGPLLEYRSPALPPIHE